MRASLKRALNQDPGAFYKDKTCEDYEMPSNQWCYDAVRQRPVGAINQPLIDWINRPTFQQVVEIQKRRRASGRSTRRTRAGSCPRRQLAAHSVKRFDAAAGAEQ